MAELVTPTDAMTPTPRIVVERIDETTDTATIVLAPGDRAAPRPAPGQFNMLWSFGVGEVPISVSALGTDGTTAHTVRAVGAVSSALAATRPGDAVGVRGPFGAGWDVGTAAGHDLVIVAGGIGLAPLRPVWREVIETRSRFGRVAVLLGARMPEALLFQRELEQARDHDVQVAITVDHARRGWTGDVGVVTELLGRVELDPAAAVAMVCGPEVMLRHTVAALVGRGVAPAGIRVSLERNMQCAIGTCGHCQLGPHFVCRDGPVLPWPRVAATLQVRER